MNPARSLGPAVVSGDYKNLRVFILAPILGAMDATLMYSILRVPKPEKPEESTKSMYNELYIHPEEDGKFINGLSSLTPDSDVKIVIFTEGVHSIWPTDRCFYF
ncbi:hypothetical protein CRYUN_Cryun30bG0059900 [Craigia yunnanensis]